MEPLLVQFPGLLAGGGAEVGPPLQEKLPFGGALLLGPAGVQHHRGAEDLLRPGVAAAGHHHHRLVVPGLEGEGAVAQDMADGLAVPGPGGAEEGLVAGQRPGPRQQLQQHRAGLRQGDLQGIVPSGPDAQLAFGQFPGQHLPGVADGLEVPRPGAGHLRVKDAVEGKDKVSRRHRGGRDILARVPVPPDAVLAQLEGVGEAVGGDGVLPGGAGGQFPVLPPDQQPLKEVHQHHLALPGGGELGVQAGHPLLEVHADALALLPPPAPRQQAEDGGQQHRQPLPQHLIKPVVVTWATGVPSSSVTSTV